MAKKLKLNQVGVTEGGVCIVEGLFKLVDTKGIPLEIALQVLKKEGFICCWISFFESSIKAGWNPTPTLSKIEAAVTDVYGVTYCENVMLRLKVYIAECTIT